MSNTPRYQIREKTRTKRLDNVQRFFKSVRTHFTGTAYNRGCRCEHCRLINKQRANRVYHNNIEDRRQKQRRWTAANPDKQNAYKKAWLDRLRAQPDKWKHGTWTTYTKLRCRCAECVQYAQQKPR